MSKTAVLAESQRLPQIQATDVIKYYPKNQHLRLVGMRIGGVDIEKAAILRQVDRKVEFLNFASKDYALIPNEEVIRRADIGAKKVGAIPWHQFSGDWYGKADKHIFYTKGDRQVHGLYAFDKPYNFTNSDGELEKIQLGIAIHGSIDASLGHSIGAFTFRKACDNMVWMSFKGQSMGSLADTVAHIYRRHTKNLDLSPEAIQKQMLKVVGKAKSVMNAYEAWTKVQLNLQVAQKVVNTKMPRKYLPWYLDIEEDNKVTIDKDPYPTVWQFYNDITENIWHEDSEVNNKMLQYQTLHTALGTKEFGWR